MFWKTSHVFSIGHSSSSSPSRLEVTAAVFLISQNNVTLPAIVWVRWVQGAPNSAAVVTVLMMVVLFHSWCSVGDMPDAVGWRAGFRGYVINFQTCGKRLIL